MARSQEIPSLSSSTAFQLAKLGQRVRARFAEGLEPLGLRPNHCGVLALLAGGVPGSQQALGARLRTAPSAVVGFLDDLEAVGAVERRLDPDDRRRHVVVLTARGRDLLRRSEQIAAALDEELLGNIGAA